MLITSVLIRTPCHPFCVILYFHYCAPQQAQVGKTYIVTIAPKMNNRSEIIDWFECHHNGCLKDWEATNVRNEYGDSVVFAALRPYYEELLKDPLFAPIYAFF